MEKQTFGILEMREFAKDHSDPRVRLMMQRLDETRSRSARWCDSTQRTKQEFLELRKLAKLGELALCEIKESITEGVFEIDAVSLADSAVDLGVLTYEEYDPSRHNNVSSEIEPGDMIYYWGEYKSEESE